MDFNEINISISPADVDTAAAICNMAVPYGMYIEDYSDLENGIMEVAGATVIDEELYKKDKHTAIIHLYISTTENPNEAADFLMSRLTAAGIKYKLNRDIVREDDWANNWKAYFKPVEIGERLAICPTWEHYDNIENRAVMLLDPGSAFGTGTHATTRLCLLMMERYIKSSIRMLDIGSGSGILSIAGVLLGALSSLGVDIDKMAVKVAEENAAINGLSNAITFVAGSLTDEVTGKYDVICANIVADVILVLIPDIGTFMKPDGVFICSGIIADRVDEVKSALAAHGLSAIYEISDEGWVSIASVKA